MKIYKAFLIMLLILNIYVSESKAEFLYDVSNITIVDAEYLTCPGNENIKANGCFIPNYGRVGEPFYYRGGNITILKNPVGHSFNWVLQHELGHFYYHSISYNNGINETLADNFANMSYKE